jgi:hypothetical protein
MCYKPDISFARNREIREYIHRYHPAPCMFQGEIPNHRIHRLKRWARLIQHIHEIDLLVQSKWSSHFNLLLLKLSRYNCLDIQDAFTVSSSHNK